MSADASRIDSVFLDHQNPPQKDGFYYFTGLEAKQVPQEGVSNRTEGLLIFKKFT